MLFPQSGARIFQISAAILLCIFLSSQVPAGFAEEGGASAQALYEQAQQWTAEGRFAEAEDALIEALKLEPANAEYHFALSNIYAALYDSWQARPNSPQALALLNRLQSSLEQTLVFRPDHLAAHFNLGVLYKRRGRYEDARNEFRRVLELSPELPAGWFQIGSTYHQQGFWDEAQDAYLRARDLGYDSYAVSDTLQQMQNDRAVDEKASSRSSAGFGSLGNSGFGAQNTGLDALGGSQSLYGANANQQGNPGTNALPSLAAMMIQQMLSRNSQSNDGSAQ